MKKSIITLLAIAGIISTTQAQTTIIDTGFTTNSADGGYANGDLVNNTAWAAVANTGANAFNVTDAENDGFADTATTDGVDTNTGDYVYLDTTSFGNAVNDQWSGVMDFQLSLSTNTFEDANGDVWRLGLSSVVDTNLDNIATNQLYMRIATLNNNGRIIFRAPTISGGSAEMARIEAGFAGWDGTNNTSTDMLRLTWNMRKTRDALVSGYYTMECSVSNLVSGTNLFGSVVSVEKPLLHADASPDIVMGHAESSTAFADTESVDITIDSLSFTKASGVLGSLLPPIVMAESDNQLVDLNWDHVVEAESYDVTQIVGGITSVVANAITTNYFGATGLVNGEEYIYIVTANSASVPSVDSEPVSGFPDTAVTGTILDTTFASTDTPPYSDGDLAGQNSWKNLAVGPESDFNVDSTGAGFAETETLEAGFDYSAGNVIYYNKTMSNEVNMAWNGSITFNFDVDPEPGLYVTNITEGVTNIQQVADLGNVRIFSIGITDNPVENFGRSGGGDAAVVVRTEGDGDIEIGLNANSGTDPMSLFLTRDDAGWDPEWRDPGPSNAPVFVTQPITLNWTIRKTSVENMYMMVVDATVGTNFFAGTPLYTDLADDDSLPDEVYPAELVYLAMVHDAQAQLEDGVGQIVHVYVDSLSVTHTNDGFVAYAPYGLAADQGNLTLDLTWQGAGDFESYSIWRSDSTDPDSGPYTQIASNLSAAAYTDTGLIDKRTYFYKIVAHYPGSIASDASEVLIIRALGSVDVPELHWGEGTDVVSSDTSFTRTGNIIPTGGDVYFSEGNGPTDEALIHSADVAGYNEVPLYGVLQVRTNSNFSTTGIDSFDGDDHIRIAQSGDGPYSAVISMKPSSPLNLVETTYTMKATVRSSGNVLRFAIRNAGTWYVSQHDFDNLGDTLADLASANWAEFDIATSSMTNLMADARELSYGTVEGLTSVDAIGYYVYDGSGQTRVTEIVVSSGSSLDSYEQWEDSAGLYNENGGRTNDPDADGLNNAWEWGQGGDPLDPEDQGYTNRYVWIESGPTNYLVYVHPRRDNPRPETSLSETYNLQYVDFEPYTNALVTVMYNWEGDTDFQTVTNKIPATNDVRFIQLHME